MGEIKQFRRQAAINYPISGRLKQRLTYFPTSLGDKSENLHIDFVNIFGLEIEHKKHFWLSSYNTLMLFKLSDRFPMRYVRNKFGRIKEEQNGRCDGRGMYKR